MNKLYVLRALPIFFCVTFFVFTQSQAQVSVTCPADIVASNDAGNCSAVVTYTPPVGTGIGTNITTNLTAGLPSGATFPVGTTIVEYTVTNDEGDSDVCSFNVTVEDDEDPVIDCPPDIVVDAALNACSQTVMYSIPTATDNCDPVVVTQIGGLPSGSSFPVGESFLDFQTTDLAGNNGFCRIIVLVNDITPPTITCPNDIEVDVFGACDTVINYSPPAGTDACGIASTGQIAGLGPGSSFPVGTTIETYEVTDEDGNMAQCSINITVNDAAPPTILNCPIDIVQVVPAGNCEDMVNFIPPAASDNCPGVNIIQTDGLVTGSNFPVGVTNVEFTATDAAGNVTTCSFTVTLTENVLPEIICPADITVSNDAGDCGAVVTYATPIGTDNCLLPSTSQTAGLGSGSFFPVGTTTETFEVVDISGNSATCDFTVTVNDTEPPAISCPDNIEVVADIGTCERAVTFMTPSFTDNCPGGSIVQTNGLSSGSSFPVGVTTIEFTATDANGVQSVCSFDIIVNDEENPIISCPADISATIFSGACDTTITYLAPTATDNCPGVSVGLVSGPTSGDLLMVGDYTVTYLATDAAGNTDQCSFNITISEVSLPVFDCPVDFSVPADPGGCTATVTFAAPTATDPCSSVMVTQTVGPASGSIFPAGSTTIEFTAEDEFGNTETCSFDITVVDDENPTITCPENISVNTDPSTCGASVTYDPPMANDNCGIASINLLSGLSSGSLFSVGITTVTYEVVDVSGNSTQCSFDVEVIDNEAPIVNCPMDITVNIPDGNCEGEVLFPAPLASDNCAIASINQTEGLPSGSDFPVGVNTVSFEAIDVNGVSSTCSFTITILEGVSPTISCPTDIVVNTDPGLCGATVIYTPPAGTDDCSGANTALTSGLGSGNFFPTGITIEEYTVTDLSGNSVTCSFTVTVTDLEPPVLDCSADITVNTDAGVCGATVIFDNPMVTDNCDSGLMPTQVAGLASGSIFPLGTTLISFESTDLANNVGTCSFNVIVLDNEDPTISCPANIEINAGLECSTEVNFSAPTAMDNCNVASVTQTDGPSSGSEFEVGVTTITFEAADDFGNTTACSFTVTVTEEAPPVITCPDNISTTTDTGVCQAEVNYDLPQASDDCSTVSLTLISGFESGESFPLGTTIVTYQAEDEQGNTALCSFEVTVVDEEAPIFDCLENSTIPTDQDNCGAAFTYDVPTAIDNCSNMVNVIQTAGPISGTLLPLGVTTFSFEATDDNGNTAICSFDITVSDQQDPVFNDCPSNIIIDLNPDACDTIVTFNTPTALDNCGVATLTQTLGPISGEALRAGTYDVEFLASDDAGNSEICSFSIQINDVTPPSVFCPESFRSCDQIVDLPLPLAIDDCDEVTINQTEGPSSGNVFPVGITTISFEVLDASNNSTLCSYEVEVLEPTTRPILGPDQGVCDATTAMLSGNQPVFGFGTWFQIEGSGDIEDPLSPNTTVSNLSTGTNTFIWSIDPDNGCDILSDSINIFVEDDVIVEAGEDVSILRGGSAGLFGIVAPPDGIIAWNPPESLSCFECLNPLAAPTETTQYILSYATPLGCLLTDSVLVRVFTEIPNTITPDDDGVNDVWNIPEIENFPDVSVQIYNRWGIEVFSSTGYNEPWDGTKDNDDLPSGSYFYVINYNRQGVENLNGTVNLIR